MKMWQWDAEAGSRARLVGSSSCDARRSVDVVVGPVVGALSRQNAMKAAKESSSWRCSSACGP